MAVAVFVHDHSTSGAAYSGGRYHALLVAHALARAGAAVTMVAGTIPAVAGELTTIPDAPVVLAPNPAYVAAQVEGRFDVVLVAPTGGLCPEFYTCAQEVARRCDATLAVLNFESANWFNALAPTPDHPEVWDYWRRVVARGGIVVSSTREAARYAPDFYAAEVGRLRFGQCYPPVNPAVARHAHDRRSDGSILYFARPAHDHKGGADILRLPESLFAGRMLRVVFGGGPPTGYLDALRRLVRSAPGATLQVYDRVPESRKFELLARAGVLLFPSWFEGFGYPPVEAAAVGTPSVCYDLPVLRETVGDVASLVPRGDVASLAAAAEQVLRLPPAASVLRAAVRELTDIDLVGARLVATLADPGALTVHEPRDAHPVLWGPWRIADVSSVDRRDFLDIAPAPPTAEAVPDRSGWLQLIVTVWTDSDAGSEGRLSPADADAVTAPLVVLGRCGRWRRCRLSFRVPPELTDRELVLRSTGRDQPTLLVRGWR